MTLVNVKGRERREENILFFPQYFRSKNTVNILIKNWLDMCIGALVMKN